MFRIVYLLFDVSYECILICRKFYVLDVELFMNRTRMMSVVAIFLILFDFHGKMYGG